MTQEQGCCTPAEHLMRRYLDMVNRVLAQHKPMETDSDQCRVCAPSGYPCVTIKVMTGQTDASQ